MWVKSGTTDRKIPFKMGDTGLSAFTVSSSRNGGAPVTFDTPTVAEVDDSILPGEYALTLDENTTMDEGSVTEQLLIVVKHAGFPDARIEVTLFNNLPSDVVKVNGENTGVIIGSAVTGTLSTVQATTDLTGFAADQLRDRRMVVLSGDAEGESRIISDFSVTGGLLTFEALTTAMGDGDKFKIV